jgi:3-oxoadipate enol-lactonase
VRPVLGGVLRRGLRNHRRRLGLRDLRGHGDGISAGSRFPLEDCADDIAALAGVLDIGRFVAVRYSMGGMVAQLLYRRHAALVSGLVLCLTSGNVLGSVAEQLAALALPAAAGAVRRNPFMQLVTAEVLGPALLGPIDDPATARWARAEFSRTTRATAVSAINAVCEFNSDSWISQVDIPSAVVVTTRDRIVPASRQLELARAIPGASVHEVDADHAVCITAPQVFAQALLNACWSVEPGRSKHARHARPPSLVRRPKTPAGPVALGATPAITYGDEQGRTPSSLSHASLPIRNAY